MPHQLMNVTRVFKNTIHDCQYMIGCVYKIILHQSLILLHTNPNYWIHSMKSILFIALNYASFTINKIPFISFS
jgi:hypothetical protein